MVDMGNYPVSTDALSTSMGYKAFDIHELSYDAENNVIVDECGFVIHDIFRIIDPNLLFLFKKNKQSMSRWDSNGDLVVLRYPDIVDEYGYEG